MTLTLEPARTRFQNVSISVAPASSSLRAVQRSVSVSVPPTKLSAFIDPKWAWLMHPPLLPPSVLPIIIVQHNMKKKGMIKFPVNIQESYENLAMWLFCPESIKLSEYLICFSFPSVSFQTKLGFMNGRNPTAMPFSQGRKTDTAKKIFMGVLQASLFRPLPVNGEKRSTTSFP